MEPTEIRLPLGALVEQLIDAKLARREGDMANPVASRAAVDLVLAAINTAVPGEAIVGFDCDGDEIADFKTLEEAVAAVGADSCECRWSPTAAPKRKRASSSKASSSSPGGSARRPRRSRKTDS